MKKSISLLLSMLVGVVLLFPATSFAESSAVSTVKVVINGNEMDFSPSAVAFNNNTMVPFRQVFEVFGATVDWDSKTKSITAKKGDTVIQLAIDSQVAYFNGKEYQLTQAPYVGKDNHVFVNLRFVSESLGAVVDFKKNPEPTVYITFKEE